MAHVRRIIVVTVAALATAGVAAGAQVRRTAYLSLGVGAAIEPEQFSVRSQLGLSLSASLGRYVSTYSALEARLGGEFFPAPTRVVNPGGCLGQIPCNPPQASPVHITTAAANAVVSPNINAGGPRLLVGFGLRRLTEAPQHPVDVGPFAALGVAVDHSFGKAHLGLEAQYQRAASRTDLPQWTMPIGITVHLF